MPETRRTRRTVGGLLLLCFLLYFWELGRIPFYNYEESKEALIVWEIVNDGGWILPRRNGTEMPLKPPLFHWIGAGISLLGGQVSEFAVRAPSAVAASAAVVLTFFCGQAWWSWRVGLFAALILATSPEWARWAIHARSDMLLVFFMTAAMLSFFQLWQEPPAGPALCTCSMRVWGWRSWPKGRWVSCCRSWLLSLFWPSAATSSSSGR